MQLLSSIADLKDIVNKEYIDSILADYVLSANLGALATKDSLAFSDLTSRPSKLSDFTDDVVAGKYLPLTGGTISGTSVAPLIINTSASESSVVFRINSDSKTQIGYNPYLGSFIYNYSSSKSIGIKDDGTPHYNGNTIYHAGNFNPADYLPLSGGTLSSNLNILKLDGTSESWVSFSLNGVDKTSVGYSKELSFIANDVSTARIGVNDSGTPLYKAAWNGTEKTLLHSGNYATEIGDYYLKSSGGILSDSWSGGTEIRRTDANNGYASLIFSQGDGTILGRFGFGGVDNPLFITQAGGYNILLHSGNMGDYVLKVDGSNGMGVSAYIQWTTSEYTEDYSAYGEGFRILKSNVSSGNYRGGIHVGARYGWQLTREAGSGVMQVRFNEAGESTWQSWKTIAFTDSNVASATKLATPRTLWGQSFDGTGNVSGNLNLNLAKLIWHGEESYSISCPNTATAARLQYAAYDGHLFQSAVGQVMLINSSGNVTIGSSDLAGTSYALCVSGANKFYDKDNTLKLYTIIKGSGIQVGRTTSAYTGGYNAGVTIGEDDSTLGFIAGAYNESTGSSKILFHYGGTNQNNASIFINGISGSVGIRKSNPAYLLEVNGTFGVASTSTFSGLTTHNSGISTPHITIGGITLSVVDGALKIDGNVFATGQLATGEAGQATSGGGSVQYWSNEYDMDIGTDILVSSKEYIGTNTIVGWDLAGSCLNDLYIGYDGYTIWMQGSVDEASDMRLKTVIDAVNLDIRDIAFAPIFNYVFKSRPQGRQMLGSSAQYWQAIAPKAVSENDKGNLAMNYGAIALASVVAVAKKVVTHEEEIANLKLEVQDLKQRLAKYELN